MNKKGRFAILVVMILFVIVAGMFATSNVDVKRFSSNTAVWEVSFLRAVQDAQQDQLLLEVEARDVFAKVAEQVQAKVQGEDLGCGKHRSVPLLNQQEKFCGLTVIEQFTILAKQQLEARANILYNEIIVQDGYVVAKTEKKKQYHGSMDAIPTEKASCGLFCSYDAYLTRPFYLKYETNVNFKAPAPALIANFTTLQDAAQLLVSQCTHQQDLQGCLDQHKPNSWSYTSCTVPLFSKEQRKVVFCTVFDNNPFYFALDFSQRMLPFIENLAATKDGAHVVVSFDNIVNASSYTIYLTDNYDLLDYQGPASQIYRANNLYLFEEIHIFSLQQQCSSSAEIAVAYICNNDVQITLKDEYSSELLVAVTARVNGEESLVNGFTLVE